MTTITTYDLYRLADFNATGTTVSLVAGYTGADDPVLVITDGDILNDDILDGDNTNNESGNDADQNGIVTFSDSSTISGSVYAEDVFTLTAPGQTTISLYSIEIDGQLIGYLPSTPLVAGVTYNYTGGNVTPANSPDFADLEGAICFSGDNLIETANGALRATELTPDTMLRTRDNGYQPLKWVFKRTVTPEELRKHSDLRPILFQADALGVNRPHRPMHLSPQHRVVTQSALNELYFGDSTLLTPAKGLVNGDTIRVDDQIEEIEYVHLLMDRHELIYCDGIEAETFDPGQWALRTLTADAREELEALFPEIIKGNLPEGFHQYSSISAREAVVLTT